MTDFIMLFPYINKVKKYVKKKSKFIFLYFKKYTTKFENLQFHLLKVFHIKIKINSSKNKQKNVH